MNANPFLKKRTYRVDEALLTTIRSIPGLGGVKARNLLEHFGSMKIIYSIPRYIGYKSMVKVHVPVEFKESKIAKLTFLRVHKKCFLYLYLDSVSQSESANIPLILTMVKFSQFQDDSCPYRIESYGPFCTLL